MPRAGCANWKWKSWPKAANGCANGCNGNSKNKPTATAVFFPRSTRKARHRRRQTMHLRTGVGIVELKVWQGQDPSDKHWGIAIREWWSLKAHQQMSPAWEEKLALTATLTGSYAD